MGLKLQGIHDGRLYASDGRTVLREAADAPLHFERLGRLPLPSSVVGSLGPRLQTTRPWKSALERLVGAFQTTNVWPLGPDLLLATAGRVLFRSTDGGETWIESHRLPPSSSPMGVLPCGVCRHDGRLYLGEYPLDPSTTPRLLVSDDGASWETAMALPDVRHVHAVQSDPYTGDLWLTTGDADDESRICRLRDGDLEIVGGGSQRWRAVQLAFTPDAVCWGVDCVYADRNDVFRLERTAIDRGEAEPTSVHAVSASIYYAATFVVDGTQWVAFSTAAEAGADSTGPTDQRVGESRASVIAASAATNFTEWHTLAAYERRRGLTDHVNPGGRLPAANAYVLLAADPDRGLFVNPYNTTTADRTVRLVPTSAFSRLDRIARPV